MFKPRSSVAQGGYTIIEVLIAMAILVILTQSFAVFMKSAVKQTTANRLKAEANEHAIQMLEELRSIVIDDNSAIAELDKYSDGRNASGLPNYKFTLTTKANVIHPAGNTLADNLTATHPLSANPVMPNGFTFIRHIDVVPDPHDLNLRNIIVRVWQAAPNAGPPPAAWVQGSPMNSSKIPMAEVFGTVRSLAKGSQPTQVMDVYMVALENVPGWWSRTSNLIPLMHSTLISLQSRNPGMVIRSHWIRRLSYGRDMEYTPELNASIRADTSNVFKKTYIYPGLVQYDDIDDAYYLSTWFKGRIIQDGTLLNSASDPVDGYPMADQWNHAMRAQDEANLYAIHQQVNANRGAEPPEISLRMLMDKLNDPADITVKNSIIINLHGEMVPLVPLRNYSDAAKDPAYYWGGRGPAAINRAWRVVTHPERLAYSNLTGTGVPTVAALRVYAYDMNPPADPITVTDEDDIIKNVTLFIPGGRLSNLQSVARIRGNSRYSYNWVSQTATSWVMPSGTISDSVSPTTATWIADEYTPPGSRSMGLRIQLFGVTPTARPYGGSPN